MSTWEDLDDDFGEAKKGYACDQWDNEEDGDVLDDWDAEPEEKKPPPPKKEPKKKKEEVIEWEDDTLSDEEAEKQRRKKLQLKADMQHGADLFGIDDGDFGDDDVDGAMGAIQIASKFDSTNPENLQDFQKFAQWIAQDLNDRFKKSEHYREFNKALMAELTRDYDAVDLRALAGTFTAKSQEKVQAQKAPKKKKTKKKIGKEDPNYDMVEDEFSFMC